ncbi:MAG TPA: Mur ligase family protein [Thermomicrobiales bacterium]|nr:Mur ligase family protein [Thermomicrobiales bacterium]
MTRSDQLGMGESLDPRLTTYRQRAEFRLDRMREMLPVLGDPLSATPIVHVAGTSGKGSTATAIASILTAGGYRTGLHTSPYLQIATEKLQIDHELIAGDAFATLVERTLDLLEGEGFQPSYGQLWMAMVLSWFEQEAVDVAVIEAGAGGRFDLSNVVHPLVSVITEIGFDHMDTLGSTIEEIAWHKAGIIEPVTPVVAAVSDRTALQVIAGEAHQQGADLHRIIPTAGDFRRTNAATARLAVELLDFDIDRDDIEDGLSHDRLPGRTETVQTDPIAILDGAHNPQKIAALLQWFAREYAHTHPIVVCGFLEVKDARAMLHQLADLASTLILTEPVIEDKKPTSAGVLAEIAKELDFTGPVHVEIDANAAVAVGLELARRTNQPLLVTGSLYLVGNVRGRWYPDDAVLLQRTPWPHQPKRL